MSNDWKNLRHKKIQITEKKEKDGGRLRALTLFPLFLFTFVRAGFEMGDAEAIILQTVNHVREESKKCGFTVLKHIGDGAFDEIY